MSRRIGVFLCSCGPNLGQRLDLPWLRDAAAALPKVAHAEAVDLLCSRSGGERLTAAIRERRLDRIVVGGCSPSEHEEDFRRALEAAGLNRHLLQVANLREQCAWVTADPAAAGWKAAALLRGAVERVAHHEPLEPGRVPVDPAVLVAGAGAAGLAAALTLSEAGRTVHLAVPEPYLGGGLARDEEEDGSGACTGCRISSSLLDVMNRANVHLWLGRTVSRVTGAAGRFRVALAGPRRGVAADACLGCRRCTEACPGTGPEGRRAVQVPFEGAIPNAPVVDPGLCVRSSGEPCSRCREACPVGAVDLDVGETSETVEVGAVILALPEDPGAAAGRTPAGMGALVGRPTPNPLVPVETSANGIYRAADSGAAGELSLAAVHGHAAAARVLASLRPGEWFEGVAETARVDAAGCVGCGACAAACPAGALTRDADRKTAADRLLCRGCGACAAVCPGGAAQVAQVAEAALRAEVRGLLEDTGGGGHRPRPLLAAFQCRWCADRAADAAGRRRLPLPEGLLGVRVPCSSAVGPGLVLEAFRRGADGVLVLGCPEGDCHYGGGDLRADARMGLVRRLLRDTGVDPERLVFARVGAGDGERFAELVREAAAHAALPASGGSGARTMGRRVPQGGVS